MIPLGIDRPYYNKPYVTYTIMALCALVELVRQSAARPDDMIVALGYVAGHGSLVTLFTSMFTHGGWAHLIGNMLFLWLTGIKVEDALGKARYLLLYLGSGVAANMIYAFLSPAVPVPMVGASGAIAGIMGAFMILYPHSRVKLLLFFCGAHIIYLPSWLFLGFWFVKEAASIPFAGMGGGVAFAAHAGGFFAGALWMWSFFGWDSGEDLELESAEVIYAADTGF